MFLLHLVLTLPQKAYIHVLGSKSYSFNVVYQASKGTCNSIDDEIYTWWLGLLILVPIWTSSRVLIGYTRYTITSLRLT